MYESNNPLSPEDKLYSILGLYSISYMYFLLVLYKYPL